MENNTAKFKIGDHVHVVNYGSKIWMFKGQPQPKHKMPIISENEEIAWYDMLPEIVGKKGTVREVYHGQYALDGIPEKTAWYNDNQLRLAGSILEDHYGI